MNIDNKFYSSETRYFRNDSCYKYISNTNITNYSTEVKVLQELFGVPLIGTNWSYMKDGIYRVITVEIIDDNSITTMTSYKDYKEYTNTIHFILNPTEYE